MQTSDFYYHLPENLIAQTPAVPRDSSRLLVMERSSCRLEHRIFHDLPALLAPGDLLVVNNSRVLPARLIGHRESGENGQGGGVCELLLLRERQKDVWECLAKPGKRLRPGARLLFGDGTLAATILETLPDGSKMARFQYDTATLAEKLDAFGRMPLPPYITRQIDDNDQYQTVYARRPGSAAAPTAGLHFTEPLLAALRESGIGIAEVTLHVGLGTFRPVKEARLEDHQMHEEWYSIGEEAAEAISRTKAAGGRVIAVGTTSCRTLESAAGVDGAILPSSGETDIFIHPGYTFKVVDGLITNFHLPESTLIMLVSAFCGLDNTMAAYREAVRREYRFFSFGDAMLIL